MSTKSPKNKYVANITFATYVEGIGQSVTVGAMSIQEVKDLAEEFKRFSPNVVIRENKKEYPEFDWVVIEEYNL